MSTKLSAILILLGLGTAAICGISLSAHEDGMSGMMDCPFAQGGSAVCPVNPMDHIAAWQRFFAANRPLGLALLLLALAFARTVSAAAVSTDPSNMRLAAFARSRAGKFIDHLKRALANGILHPKICG